MRWAKKSVVDEETGKTKKIDDKTRLIYGPDLTIEGIPETAQEYVINGRSALDWVIRQYQVTTDKASGIVNDPNEWEPDNPRYIVDLFEKLVTVSVETVNIVGGLPPLHELDQPVDWPSAWRASE